MGPEFMSDRGVTLCIIFGIGSVSNACTTRFMSPGGMPRALLGDHALLAAVDVERL
jgi:hypothetical protein